MNVVPARLERVGEAQLQIVWSDGEVRRYSVRELRQACPCATCREKRSEQKPPQLLPVLSLEETLPLRLVGMKPVGNYAYSISFSDGHDTGLFSFDLLRRLGQVE